MPVEKKKSPVKQPKPSPQIEEVVEEVVEEKPKRITKTAKRFVKPTCRVYLRSEPIIHAKTIVRIVNVDELLEFFEFHGEWSVVEGGFIKTEFLRPVV